MYDIFSFCFVSQANNEEILYFVRRIAYWVIQKFQFHYGMHERASVLSACKSAKKKYLDFFMTHAMLTLYNFSDASLKLKWIEMNMIW